KGYFEDRAHMRARDSVWRQPSEPVSDGSIQLTRKLAGYLVNSVEQEQVRRGRGCNRHIPSRDASPAPGALPPNPPSAEMQNLWRPLPGPSERECGRSLADGAKYRRYKSNRAQSLARNRREGNLDHDQLPC